MAIDILFSNRNCNSKNNDLSFCNRQNRESYLNGITSQRGYHISNIRRILSLRICSIGWIYELIGSLFIFSAPFLHEGGLHNAYFIDTLMMFVGIPLVHLINDEDIKTVIAEEGWCQGVRSIF